MTNHNNSNWFKRSIVSAAVAASALSAIVTSFSASAEVKLNEKCVINILNRTVQVRADGGWALPNIPSNMGQVRARATCLLDDGRTVSGQSEYFNIERNGITRAGDIKFEKLDPIPTSLNFNSIEDINLTDDAKSYQLTVTAYYADETVKNVSSADSGVNYSTTNPQVATVSADGLITAVANGSVLVNARKDGVLVSRRVVVFLGGDLDGDGLPDDYERENGLNPNDPVDALEDHDNDGLTAKQEFELGTDINNADTDGDGISDLEESTLGEDGVITSPLLEDTDGDGISDGLEIAGGSDPNDSSSGNLNDYLEKITVSPATLLLTYNAIDGEASSQLTVTGTMLDGSEVNLTDQSTGTRYRTDNIRVASFGINDGEIFAGENGSTKITVSNNNQEFVVNVEVTEFTPKAQAALSIPGYANNVDIQGSTAFVAAGDAGLQVVDYSDIKVPKIIAAVDTAGVAIDVKVSGNYAYLADGESGLRIFDIQDPANPLQMSRANTAGLAQDVALQGDLAFVADGSAGFEVFNIANAEAPFSVGGSSEFTDIKGISVEGNYLAVVGGSALALFDVENVAAPIRLQTVNIGPVQDVVIDNGYVYVAAYSSGYRVYKITDGNTLELKGGDRTFVPRDVAVTNGFAFFAEQLFPNVVAYLNIKDPEVPFFQDTIDLSPLGDYAGTGLALNATHAFVTEESFVVRTDYGTTGTTKLFSAQYREISDNNGIAPEVAMTSPITQTVTVEGARLILEADASDDIAVYKVEFYINNTKVGEDTTAPYSLPYSVEFGINAMAISAVATDLGGNASRSSMVTLEVQKDGDRDGLGDLQETEVYNTNVEVADTDEDGLLDGEEVARGTNPLNKDTDGDGLEDGAEVANRTDPTNPDITPPEVSEITPANEATEVPENSAIIVTFNEQLQRKSVSGASLRLLENGTTPIVGSTRLIGDDTQLVFQASELLKDYTPYTVIVGNVRDTAGNKISGSSWYTFETGNTVDTVRPTVSNVAPVNNAIDVPVNAAINILMSERIDRDSVNADTFYITDTTTNTRIDGVIEVQADDQTISFTPNVAFLVGRRHSISLRSTVADLFGNQMGSNHTYYFTTSFAADGVAPVISSSSFPSGQTDVPLNAKLRVKVSETINPYSIKQVKLIKDGAEIAVNTSLSESSTLITVQSQVPLDANASYTLFVDQLEDLSGNLLAQPYTVDFTTGDASDTTGGSIQSYSPINNAEVAANTKLTARFPGPIDFTSVNSTNFKVYNDTEKRYIKGSFALSADGSTIEFTADEWIVGDKYRAYMSNIKDLSGNKFSNSGWHYLTVVSGDDNDAPALANANILDGATEIAVNASVKLNFNEPLAVHCVNPDTVKLMLDGVEVEAVVSLNSSRTQITVNPVEDYQAGGNYQVVIEGLCDTAGNQLNGFTTSFTASSDGTVDTDYPRLQTIVPANNTEAVDVNTDIVLTFDEPIDPTNNLNNIRISVNGVSGYIAGDFAFSGNSVTFTPTNPLPGNSQINIYLNRVRDIVGNSACCWSYNFKTDGVLDTTGPQVAAITPADGAMDIGVNTPVIVTFDESLNSSTVNNTNFKIYHNGSLITPSVSLSLDGRTVALRGTWPAGQPVSVLITNEVKDLSNNAMVDYASLFSTAVVDTDNNRPSVVRQYPSSGATNVTNVDRVTLFTNELMDEATLFEAFHVAQDGILVLGNIDLGSSGQAITFKPDVPFAAGSLINVYVDSNALDDSGNAINHYQGNFRMATESGAGTRPGPTTYMPANSTTGLPVNTQIQIGYNQDLNVDYVTDSYIILRKDGGEVIPATLTLSDNKRIVDVAPLEVLLPNTYYYVSLDYRIQDTDGEQQRYNRSFGFTTGESTLVDEQQPMVVAMSPDNNAENVAINPRFHVRYDEPINPLSVVREQSMSLAFSNNNTQMTYLRFEPLVANTGYTESPMAATDVAGNAAVDYSATFTTGEQADITAPNWQSYVPESEQTVATNTPVVWVMNEVIDPLSISSSTVYVQDMSRSGYPKIPGSATLGADGRTITWVADEGLFVGRRYRAYLTAVTDLSGNVNSNDYYYFYTDTSVDTTAPNLVLTSVENGMLDVALNSRIRVLFDEPINKEALDGITLNYDGTTHPVRYSISSNRREVTLIPVALLPSSTEVTLNVANVRDLSGNEIIASSLSFTTEVGIDTVATGIKSISPAANAEVAMNTVVTVQFNERLDIVSANSSNFRVFNNTQDRYIYGQFALDASGTRLSFTPNNGWTQGDQYRFYMSNLRDVAGNKFSNSGWHYFTVVHAADSTGPAYTVSNIVNGATEIAVNSKIKLQFNEPLAAHCVNGDSVKLLLDGVEVAANISLSSGRNQITVDPAGDMVANGNYQVVVSGVCDVSGNQLNDYSLSFTSSSTGSSDTSYPRLQTIVPANNAENIPVSSTIVMTFDEPIDPTNTLDNFRISVNGTSGYVAGSFDFAANVVTFTPADPLPGDSQINVYLNRVRDIVGNSACCWSYNFKTESVLDTEGPQIIAITPADGAMDIGVNTPVVLTFNESLNGSTVGSNQFKLHANGNIYTPNVSRSLDGKTVALRGTWPAGQLMTVIVTDGVKDLSNNAMANYASVFTTAVVDTDDNRPSVVRQYPSSGATNVTNVDKITIMTSELMDASTVEQAFDVAQNGHLITGQVELASSGQAVTFTPDQPFEDGALIHVYLNSNARDDSGNSLNAYQGHFTMANLNTVGIRPNPTTYVPANGSADVMVNSQIQVGYNQMLDEAYVNSTYMSLRVDGGEIVPATYSLSADKYVVTVTPDAPLLPSTYYYVSLDYRILDTDGERQNYNRSFSFTTGASDVADSQQPMVVMMSPPTASENVALNPRYNVRFDEPMNPLSLNREASMSLWLAHGNREVSYLRYAPLAAATEHTEVALAMTDVAGNAAVNHSTTFTTGETVDVTVPNWASYLPASETTVATNVPVTWFMNEPIDAVSIDSSTVYVQDMNLSGYPKVAGSASLGADGRTITWVADNGLLVGRRYRAYLTGVTDLSGNVNSNDYYYFYTAMDEDVTAPSVSLTSVKPGLTDVATNLRMRVRFDEPISKQQLSGITMVAGGADQVLRFELNGAATELTIIPVSLLPVNSQVTVTLSGVQDLAGNVMADESLDFFTSDGTDLFAHNIVSISPTNIEVPMTTQVTADYNDRIDMVTVNSSNFKVYNDTQKRYISGSYSVSEDGTKVTFSTNNWTAGDKYRAYLSNIRDLAGNKFASSGWHYFTIVDGSDADAPVFSLSNVSEGAVLSATNTPIKLQFNEPLAAHCVNTDSVKLYLDGAEVAATVSLSSGRTQVTVTAAGNLVAGGNYQVVATGLCDNSGNSLAAHTTSFSVSNDAVVDNDYPRLQTITPENGATDVDVNSTIVMTFDEAIDPTNTFDNFRITAAGASGYIAGNFDFNDNVVTFTPAQPLPGDTAINVYLNRVRDIAGKSACCWSYSFTTTTVFDTVPPQVSVITPADGAMDIGVNTPIVLQFNESLNSSTVNDNYFRVYGGGSLYKPSVYRSQDGQTVTLRGTWPAGETVSVIVKQGVKDLSNNAMDDWVSIFTTAVVDTDTTRPSVVRQYPSSGATNVSNLTSVSIYTNDAMNEATIADAFSVAQNGVLLEGELSLAASGQAITFTPTNGFEPSALIHVYLNSGAKDTSGNAMNNYQGNFFTAAAGSAVGVRPDAKVYLPNSGSTDVAINTDIKVLYNQDLDEAFINSSYLSLRISNGTVVPASFSLSADKRVITVTPDAALNTSTYYYVSLDYRIQDVDGERQQYNRSFNFTTGANEQPDTQQPMVLAMSPNSDATNVQLNPRYRVRFDEPISELSGAFGNNMSVSFSSNNKEVLYLPFEPLAANTEHTETVSAVQDLAGNAMVDHSETFTTGETLDVTAPNYSTYLPESEKTVATNTPVVWVMNEAIDALTISSSTVYVQDMTQSGYPKVAGTATLGADGRTITWVAEDENGLEPDRRYRAYLTGVTDLSGNTNSNDYYYFYTGPEADVVAPNVILTSIDEGLTDMPLNARVRIRFNEPVSRMDLAGVSISSDAGSYAVRRELTSARNELVLTPVSLLPANKLITVNIAGIKDIAANEMAVATLSFTTGDGADTGAASLRNYSPRGSAQVPSNVKPTVQYGERIDPTSVTSSTFKLYNDTDRRYESTSLSLGADGTYAQMDPDVLVAGKQYRVYISGLRDIAGHTLQATGWHYFTVIAGDDDAAAPVFVDSNITDGMTDVSTNSKIKLVFDEALAAYCVNSSTMTLTQDAETVAASYSLSSDRKQVTISPTGGMVAGANYQLAYTGICDEMGNKMAELSTLSFTTGAGNDSSAPSVESITPTHQSQDQAANSEIVITFNEFIDPLNIVNNASNSAVRVYTGSTYYEGDFTVTDNQVKFVPAQPFPASTKITIYLYYVLDVAGNRHCCSAMEFTTAAP